MCSAHLRAGTKTIVGTQDPPGRFAQTKNFTPEGAYYFVGRVTPIELDPRCCWFVSGDLPLGVQFLSSLKNVLCFQSLHQTTLTITVEWINDI